MEVLPLRLSPGDDLRAALQAEVAARSCHAGFVISGIGSLAAARLRLAGAIEPATMRGDLEILTLAGTIAMDGSHLHISIADASGRVLAGHVAQGCVVRTTAEVLLVLLPDWQFSREVDAVTGFAELAISHRRTNEA
jgi:predicted DNA-binding protein with PD1-like motif